MISPGTIRAASLISKGMSPDAAFREANRIDILTENRKNFLKASVTNPSTSIDAAPVDTPTATATAVPSGSITDVSTLPAPKKGFSLGNINSVMSDVAIKPSKDFTKDEVDAINKAAATVQEPKARKQISLGNPNALFNAQSASEGLSKLNPKQLGELQVNLQSSLIQAKINSLPSNITKINYVPNEYKGTDYGHALTTKLDKLYTDYNEGLLESPTVGGIMQEEHNKKLSSYQKLSNDFVQAKDFKSLRKAYDSLEKELNFIDETATKELETADRLTKSGRADLGQVTFSRTGANSLQRHRDKKELIRQEIGTVFNNRANAMLAKETVGLIKNKYQEALKQNPNLDKNKFFEGLTKQYNLEKSAFGLGQILVENGYFGSYQDYIRFTNPHKYSKKFTVEDPETKGRPQGEWGEIPSYIKNPEDVSSWALEYSKASPKESVVSGDYRFRDAKEDLLFTGIQFAGRVSEELYQESIDKIKERETLTLEYNKKSALGTLTKEDKAKYEEGISQLNQTIDYTDAFDKAVPSIYNYENIKKNSVYKNFAIDDAEFFEKTNKWNRIYNGPDTNWYDDIGSTFYHHDFFGTQTGVALEQGAKLAYRTGVNVIGEAAKFVDQTVFNKWLGVPQSSDFNKRNAIYNAYKRDLDVPEIIDERASILAGRSVSASEFFWKEKGSAWYDVNFNPRAIITGAAETLPQMMMFSAAGRGIQSVAGSAAKTGLMSGTTGAILGQKTAAQFASALSKTKNTADAWSLALKNTNNFLLKSMADKVPYGLGVAAVAYPETYNRNLERLEAMGVKDAETIARNISIPSTLIEVLSESIVPNIGYVENFAEKGTGLKKLLEKTALKKWIGSVDQYRSLYSGVLGGKFSEKTVNYLARNSAELFGQVGAGARFYASRGFEEGMEEVFSEITNGLLDNHTSFGTYKREPVQPLTIEGILSAFAGGFFVPTSGGGAQMKSYRNNKKYGAMYDMMINADYYRNHINQQFKEGAIDEKQASDMLGKLQELTAIADEYGVQNLKKKGNAAEFTSDLVNSPEKQFDYFKQILTVKGIEDKLAKEGTDLKDDERKALLEEAEEATKRIDKYQRQASYFENLSEEQKDEIVANTIKEKTKKARFETPSQILAESVQNADTKLAEAIKNKEPEKRIQALRDYRNSLIEANESRMQQKQQAVANNTYNPVTAAVSAEGEATPLDLSGVETYEDLVDVVTQALVDPDTGAELDSYMRGRTNEELADLEVDKENAIDNFLDYLEQTQAEPSPENQKKGQDTTADTPVERVKYKTISDLNDSQREMFEEFVEQLNEAYENKKAEVDKYNAIMDQLSSHAALQLQASIAQQETFYDEVYKNFAAVKKVGFGDVRNTGAELFDTMAFGLYKANNKEALDKVKTEVEAEVQKRKDAEKVEREEVTLTETPSETAVQEETQPEVDAELPVETITVPELVPSDVTPTFESSLKQLQQIVDQINTEVVQNEVTGETEVVTSLPRERTKVLGTLMKEIAKNTDLKGAQAMMASVMQVLGKSNAEIQKTLSQMSDAANNIQVEETDYTHMFGLYQSAVKATQSGPSKQAVENANQELGIEEEFDPDLKNIDPLIIAARNGDTEAQKKLEEYGLEWRQTTTYRFVGKSEADVLLSNGKVESRRFVDAGIDVTTNDKVTSAADNEYRVTFKESFDVNNGLGKVVVKSREEGDHNLQKGRGYDIKDVAKIERLDENGNVVETVYDAKTNTGTKKTTPVVTPSSVSSTKKEVSENEVAEQQNQSKILTTTPLFYPSKQNAIDIPHFEIQSRIIQSINKEFDNKKDVQTGIVDLFTLIEEVLGEEALSTLEGIFDTVNKPGVTTQEINQAKREFVNLFPAGFIRMTAMRYIFNEQMMGQVSQSDVEAKDKEILDADDSEIIALNRGRTVSIQMADGRKYANVIVTSSKGSLFFLVEGGKEDGTDLWLSESRNNLDRTKDKIIGLKYPKVGEKKIQFSDLNVLVFTVFDKNGKVQKYSDDGNRNEEGNKVLYLNLPTTKGKETTTDLQKAFNKLRKQLVAGERVKISAPITKTSDNGKRKDIKQEDGTVKSVDSSYSFDFNAENVVGEETLPSPVTVYQQEQTAEVIGKFPPTQAIVIAAVEKMIADSKAIPDPSKEGYLINGKRYERQSNFVKRVLGDKSVNTEQSVVNMEMGAAVGNFLDIVGRDILGGNKLKTLQQYLEESKGMGKTLRGGKGYDLMITQGQFNDLVKELEGVRDELNAQGWKLFTEGLIVHREFSEAEKKETGFEGVAGAMDILAVDPQGNVHIIDFKNKKFNQVDKFTTTLYTSKAGYPSNVSKWSTQQTTYAILGADFGLPVESISILAFASEYSEEGGMITIDGLTLASKKAEVNNKFKSPVSSSLIALNYDPKIIKHLELRTSNPTKAALEKASAPAPAQPTDAKVDISKEVILSGLRDGFKAVSYSSFDVRSDENVMNQINKQESFLTTIEKNGKRYVIVGLFIKQDIGGRTSGRDGYSFAMIEDTGSLPSNIVDLLKEQAINNVSNIYPNIDAVESSFEPIKVSTQSIDAKADIERRRQEVKKAIRKAGQGEGGQFTVTLLDGTKENAVRISLVGHELGVGNKGVVVDLSIIKKIENPDGTVVYDAELAALEQSNLNQPVNTQLGNLDNIRENLPEIPKENMQNVFDALTSLGVDVDNLSSILPSEGTVNPDDIFNTPPCS